MRSRFRSEQYKSSSSNMFFKLSVDKNVANFNGKHLCWGLFIIKLQPLGDSNTGGFSVKFAKFLRTPFFCKANKNLRNEQLQKLDNVGKT